MVRGLIVVGCAAVYLSAAAPASCESNEGILLKRLAENPNDWEANHQLGEFYARAQKFRDSVKYLAAAYRLNPSEYANAYDLGRAELEAGDAAAARDFVRGLISRTDRPELHNLLGDCEEASGNFREASEQYQIAARADPSEPNLFSFASELLKYRGYSEALQVLAYATRKYPGSARLRVALGVAQYSTGNYADAVKTLCEAIDQNPEDPRPLEFLGKMNGVAPELSEQVRSRLQHFALTYPNNAAANYYYASSLLDVHDFQRAKRFLQRAIALRPNFPEAHYQLGIVWEQAGDSQSAVREFKKAASLQPEMSAPHYHLARLYQKAGQTALAAKEFEAVKRSYAQ